MFLAKNNLLWENSGDDSDDIDRPPVQLGLAPYRFEPVKRDRRQSESVDQPGTSSGSASPDFSQRFLTKNRGVDL